MQKIIGGAFGIGGNSTIGFIIVSIIVLGIAIRFLISQRNVIDYKTSIAISLVLAGGINNLIDRSLRGYVVDYIDISSIFKFPVFNIPDMLICIGWFMLVICVYMYWKKEIKEPKKGKIVDGK